MVETVINQNDGLLNIVATGGETSLAGDFPIYEKSHVTIKRVRGGVTTTGVLNTDYTIADNQLEVTAGFTAVLAGSWTPAVAGDTYTLLLAVPESRVTDFNQAGDFFASTLNQELDLEVQMIQQLRRDANRSPRLPDTFAATSAITLPEPVAGRLIGWTSADGVMQNYNVSDLGGVPISSFGSDLIAEVNAVTARSRLGAAASGINSDITALTALTEKPVKAINIQVFTASSGTYTPSAGMLHCWARGWGGGGGGGGVTAVAGASAAGGGAGGYSEKLLTAAQVGASQLVAVGAGGTAGANTGGNGGTGGTTSVGSLLVAAGGAGGQGATSATVSYNGGPGGAGSTSDLITAGAPGGPSTGGTTSTSGHGGSTSLGGGGRGLGSQSSNAGTAGLANTGGGGAGANNGSSASANVGGVGGSGVVIITEYCSQ